MLRLGRFHLIRVFLAVVCIVLLLAIIANNRHDNSLIHLKENDEFAVFTWAELSKLSQANETCPVCFGRDACDELKSDVIKGALKVAKKPQKLDDLRQTVHSIYRNGAVRFWMRTQPSSPSLLQGFEQYICAKAGSGGQKEHCDVSVAAKSAEFLYAANADLDTIRGLYKFHLVSRRRIPATSCPSWKFVQGLIQAFDDDDDQVLTVEEKVTLISTLATNPEIAIYKLILNQKLAFPILPYFGSCGRLTFVQGNYKSLSSYLNEPLAVRANLAAQVLQLVDGFIQDDPHWLLFTRDLGYANFVVTEGNQVFLKDLSHVLLIDKDAFDAENEVEVGDWSNEKFDQFYDALVDTKNEDKYQDKCSQSLDYAGHMFSIACQFILSDLQEDVEARRSNPLAQSYPGLLHHLEGYKEDGNPLFDDIGYIENLLQSCSSGSVLEKRQEAGLQLLQVLFDLDPEEDADDATGIGHDDYEQAQDGPADGDSQK